MPEPATTSRPKTTCQWMVRYKRAIKLPTSKQAPITLCSKVWAKKCSFGMPTPRGDGIIGLLSLMTLHKKKQCPCFNVDYGATAHRWCDGGIHLEGARLYRRGDDGGEKSSNLKRLKGSRDTRITDFFSPTEERWKVKREGNPAEAV